MWGLGDAVLMTAILRVLQGTGREVWVLCKPESVELISPSYEDIRFVTFDFPWTRFRGKYVLWRWPWKEIFGVIRKLRGIEFDEAVTVRSDPRDHLFMVVCGAKDRYGFPRWGSGVLLSRPVRPSREVRHRVDEWRLLGTHLTSGEVARGGPWLKRTGRSCRKRHGTQSNGEFRLVLHCGAGNSVRRWPLRKYSVVLKELRRNLRFHLTVVADRDGFGSELGSEADRFFQPQSVDELLRILSDGDVFLGNDSGPAHIAAALGLKVITIFGPQLPEIFAPCGEGNLAIEGMPCRFRPCSDACRYSEPYCLTRISEAKVAAEIIKILTPAGT